MLEKISEVELKRRVSRQSVNFMAFPVTPWAAHGVDAYIHMLKKQGIELKGYICIVKHGQAGYLLEEKHFSFRDKNIKIVQIYENPRESFIGKIQEKIRLWGGLLKRNTNGKEKIFILNQGVPNFKWHAFFKQCKLEHAIESVVIDEGIGMYMRDKKAWITENLSNANGVKAKLSAYLMMEVRQPLMTWIVKRHEEVRSFCLLNKGGTQLIRNETAILHYKAVIYASSAQVPTEEKELYRNAVVINTQPFYEYGQVKQDEDLKWIREICKASAEQGLSVVLKPHPREKRLDRYDGLDNCVIDFNKGVSQESIISQITEKPALIVGFSSTTLITEKLFENIQAISLVNCIEESNFEDSVLLDFMGFRKTFSDYTWMPKDRAELWEQLKIIRRRCGR